MNYDQKLIMLKARTPNHFSDSTLSVWTDLKISKSLAKHLKVEDKDGEADDDEDDWRW